jgi:hypothetical protein
MFRKRYQPAHIIYQEGFIYSLEKNEVSWNPCFSFCPKGVHYNETEKCEVCH